MSFFFFSSRRRHTRLQGDWSSDVCSSDLSPATRTSTWKTSPPFGATRVPDPLQYEGCSVFVGVPPSGGLRDRKSTRLNSSHLVISYAVFCLKKKNICAADAFCDCSLVRVR